MEPNNEFEIKRCPNCLRDFEAYNPKKVFCTDRCRSAFYNKNHIRVPLEIIKPNDESLKR